MSEQKRPSSGSGYFRGTTVWTGVALALIGFLLQEWSGAGPSLGLLTFAGGMQVGVGIMHNRMQERDS